MIDQIRHAGQYAHMFQTLLSIYAEKSAYSKGGTEDPTHVTEGEALHVKLWREAVGYSIGQVKKSSLPYIIGRMSKLFYLYDDVCDNAAQGVIPTFNQFKDDPRLRSEVGTLINVVRSSGISHSRQYQLLGMVNEERYTQGRLQLENAYRQRPLSGTDAIKWREDAAGHFAGMYMKAGNIYFGIDDKQSEAAVDAGYWFGANMQLFDDISDIGEDVRGNRQSAFYNVLLENPPEMKRVREYLDDTRLAIIPGSVIPNLAGASFDMLQKQRRDYYEKIPNDPRYREMRFYANPDHYDPMARLYEKTFAVRTRDHLPVHQIVWTLIRG